MNRMPKTVLSLGMILAWGAITSAPAFAAGSGGLRAALELRSAIERKSGEVPTPPIAEHYELPVSRGFNQRMTELCWAYATLNQLETIELVRHPELPLELSRGYLQHTTWQDRLERRLADPRAALSERGTAINALKLIAERGVSQFADYADSTSEHGPDPQGILADVADLPTFAQKAAKIASDLDSVFGALPGATWVGGQSTTPLELGRRLTALPPGERWISYAVAGASHAPGWGADPDPDGRGDYQVLFVPIGRIRAKIHDSLKRGVPVTFSNLAHLVLIYGADYDAGGNEITFRIKDSYPDYFYEADPTQVYKEMLEVTTLGPET
jgi:hypothetical protein